MANKKYNVIFIDYGDECNGKAKSLGLYKTFDSAYSAMQKDIQDYKDSIPEDDDDNSEGLKVIHKDNDSIKIGNEYYGCQWQILEVEVKDA